MIALDTPVLNTLPTGWDEALLRLQLRVARYADALARGLATDPGRDRVLWFEAERIVLGEVPVGACADAAA